MSGACGDVTQNSKRANVSDNGPSKLRSDSQGCQRQSKMALTVARSDTNGPKFQTLFRQSAACSKKRNDSKNVRNIRLAREWRTSQSDSQLTKISSIYDRNYIVDRISDPPTDGSVFFQALGRGNAVSYIHTGRYSRPTNVNHFVRPLMTSLYTLTFNTNRPSITT